MVGKNIQNMGQFIYLCRVFLCVFLVRKSGTKLPTQPVCTSRKYEKSKPKQKPLPKEVLVTRDSDDGDDEHGMDEDPFTKLPFIVEEKGDKVVIDKASWEGVKTLMRYNKEVVEKIEKEGSGLVLPKVSEGAIICPSCGIRFKTPTTLRKHMEKSHRLKERVECSDCRKTFVSKVVMIKHFNQTHKKKKSDTVTTFKCKLCDKTFGHSWELGQHSRYIHKDDRNIQCKYSCGKTYSTQASMNSHLSSCKENPNFVKKTCLYKGCEKSYTKQCDLNSHMKKAHGWEKAKGKGGKGK
jgi:uncharacterized C2H2 Zn-finger protein